MALLQTNLNVLHAGLFIENLKRLGVKHVVVCPGSRSSPLTAAMAATDGFDVTVHYDERGAAFFALGIGKATGTPAVLITTSGTAVAEALPAVIEASQSHQPLMVVTGDRPPELQDCGANQTIVQQGLFGSYLRYENTLACPDGYDSTFIPIKVAAEAFDAATGPDAGPVYVNMMFREPLAPHQGPAPSDNVLKAASSWYDEGLPTLPALESSESSGKLPPCLRDAVATCEKGVVILGELPVGTDIQPLIELAEERQWPILADIGSQHRLGCDSPNVISYYDQALLSEPVLEALKPDAVIQLGDHLVSKRLQQFLERHQPPVYAVVKTFHAVSDPGHISSDQVCLQSFEPLTTLLDAIPADVSSDWLSLWKSAGRTAAAVIERELDDGDELSEPAVIRLTLKKLPEGAGVMLSNSMPVRDADMYADGLGPVVSVGTNRGASGIDGIIATAAGFSKGLARPVVCLVGDLATLHDLNSMPLLKAEGVQVICIVINNDGGGIFHFLPVADHSEQFEKFWGTPHGLELSRAGSLFNLDASQALDLDSFLTSLEASMQENSSCIIEVRTNRDENLSVHKALQKCIQTALNDV